MKKQTDTVKVSISIDKDAKELIEQIGLELDLTLSKMGRNLIYVSLNEFKDLERLKLGRKLLASNLKNFKATLDYYSSDFESKEINSSDFNLVQISVVMDRDVKEVLEEKAKQLNMPFKMLAANLLYVGLREARLLRKTGLLRLANAFLSFIETFENYRNNKTK